MFSPFSNFANPSRTLVFRFELAENRLHNAGEIMQPEIHESWMISHSIGNKTLGRKTTKTRKQKWIEKQLYRYFKRQTNKIACRESLAWTWLRKRSLKRETESLLVAAQNSAIRTSYINAKIDNMQQNNKSKLCEEKDKKVD